MMTQITASNLGAQHVGYIVSTPPITGMLQCVLTYPDDQGVVGIVLAGYPNVVPLNEDDPVVISGLADLAVDPADVGDLPSSSSAQPEAGSVEEAMSKYSNIQIKYRAVNSAGDELKVSTSRDAVEKFIDQSGSELTPQRMVWVKSGLGQDWTNIS
jgi:hypothetical protein